MPLKVPRLWWFLAPLVYILYFHGMSATGLLGPDEPRYASIAREMARSGDWITPRLWGAPWFEKPPLLYWMTAAAFRAGLGPEVAPRLPVALLSAAFLLFFGWIVEREFGCRPGRFAILMLAASVGWIGYSAVGVTDLPMSACFVSAMLLCLPWLATGETRFLPAAAVLLGLAVLAKGLGPLVLTLPLLWMGRQRWRDLLHWRVVLPFLLVALPWYVLCYWRNGWPFIQTLFIQQHFGRFAAESLQHGQPWWFYLPVFCAGLIPWTPLLFFPQWRHAWKDVRIRFLVLSIAFGMVFFSIMLNKLPGYVLPLLPAAAVLAAISLDRLPQARIVLATAALLLVSLPLTIQVLPGALMSGLLKAPRPLFEWTWLLPVSAAAAVWILETLERRVAAVALIAAGMAMGVGYIKITAAPQIDRLASARPLWRQVERMRDLVCVAELQRNWRYGLNYYSIEPLPDCSAAPRPLQITQPPGRTPVVERSGPVEARLDPHPPPVIPSLFRY